MIKRLRLNYPLPLACRALNVAVSGYYVWSVRMPSRRAQDDARLEVEIRAAHKRTREACGSERLREDMLTHGVDAGLYRIRKLREKMEYAVRKRRNSRQQLTQIISCP